MASAVKLLALDFDGVICDGLKEYFQTAWKAYDRLWHPSDPVPPEGLADRFYRLRPVVETGWEMPLVLRAILQGTSDDEILQNWPAIAQTFLAQEQLDASRLSAAVDGIRDEWIATDLESWLGEHRFYPGVIERLRAIVAGPVEVQIISTKEGRFIQQLLARQGVDLAPDAIWGKEVKRPKYQLLRELVESRHPASAIWFVEDRLKTLQSVQAQPDLAEIRLYLADWGYNTASDRQLAQSSPGLQLLSLQQFSQDWQHWPPTDP